MSFIAKNPISATDITSLPPVPIKGTRGIFAKEDGWYDIDDEGNVRKLGSGSSGSESVAIDTEFDINSENAIANKTVTKFVNQTNTKIISLEESVEIFANRTDEETTPFATKEEVDTKIQAYIDEAILGGAW